MSKKQSRPQLLAMLPKHAIGAEIGVWKGDFSEAILREARPQKLYLIDPWLACDDEMHRDAWYGPKGPDMESVYQNVLRRFSEERESGQVVIRRAPSAQALKEFPDAYFDFVYIDGDHEYSAVRQDCFLGFEKLRPGGLLCGDDYTVTGWWKDGVVRAFHELIYKRPVLIRYANGSQIVLQKIDHQSSGRSVLSDGEPDKAHAAS